MLENIRTQFIHLGVGTLKICSYGGAYPSMPDAEIVGAGLGAEIALRTDKKEISCGQTLGIIGLLTTAFEVTFKITLMELNMRSLVRATGLDPELEISGSGDFGTMYFGNNKRNDYFTIQYTCDVQSPNYTIIFWGLKCAVISALTLPFSKDQESTYEIEFKCVADPSESNSLCVVKLLEAV